METNNDSKVPESIFDIRQKLTNTFSECFDFSMRDFEINFNNEKAVVLIAFIEGLVDTDILNRDVISPLMNASIPQDSFINKKEIIKKKIVNCSINEEMDFNKTIDILLSGGAVIYAEGMGTSFEVKVTETKTGRAVGEPETEVTIRGPREGFVERASMNIVLLRRKLKNPNFKVEKMVIGSQTKTDIFICYIKGIVNDEALKIVKQRLNNIKADAILESGYIEQYIEDAPFSLFPTVGNSEKPDKVTAKLLEGRVGIVCDGTPMVLTVPYLLIESIQAGEDYYEKPHFSSFVRMLRIMSIIIAMSLPSVYISLLCFNQGIIPFKLLLTMSASEEGIPFSPFIEALGMIIIFELLREAGIRMPRLLGQTIGVIGAIVIGEAAVKAGIASSPMIIIVALTAINSFISNPLMRVTGIIRIIMLIAANMLGLLGIVCVFSAVLTYACSLRSFGVPYLSPLSPLNVTDLKDTFVRFPLQSLTTRPRVISGKNKSNRDRV